MPIKGLTNRKAAFPCIGKLRKGGEKPSTGKAPGPDLDHFRFDADPAILEVFRDAYGTEPREIRVLLQYDSVEENLESWMEEWKAGGMVRRCDGESIVLHRDNKGYSQKSLPCQQGSGCGCKPVGRLKVIIPELIQAGFVGYVSVETHSKHDIMRLTENLLAAEAIQGKLTGIPLILRRQKTKISTPNGSDGSRASREKWLLSIEPFREWVADRFSLAPAPTRSLPNAAIAALPEAEPDLSEEIWDKFLSALDRAQSSEQVYLAEKWLRGEKQWQHVSTRIDIEDDITAAVQSTLEQFKAEPVTVEAEIYEGPEPTEDEW